MPKKTKSWGEAFEELFAGEHPVREKEVCFELGVGENDSKTYICELWEGVFLWANEIHTEYFDYPVQALGNVHFAVLNICLSGRCEVAFTDDRYVYMRPGLFNANWTMPRNGYHYPGGFYEGIEVALDLDILKRRMVPELSSFGLTLEFLEELLQKNHGNFMASITEGMMQKSRLLYEDLKRENRELPDYRFQAVSLLYHLKNGDAGAFEEKALVTRGQRQIAMKAEQQITEDFRKHFTIEELAAGFGISPSALKKYFQEVFGQPVSHYLREKRMEHAQKLLIESRENIGMIAADCGYENQGKFSSAFKAYSGVSPLEYRRLYPVGAGR